MVMLTSLFAFDRVVLMGLAIRVEGQMVEGSTFSFGPPPWILRCPPLGKWLHLQAGLHLWPVIQVGRLSWEPNTHSALPMTCEPELRTWWTSSWLTILQVALLLPPSDWMLRCPSLGSGTWQVSLLSHTKV